MKCLLLLTLLAAAAAAQVTPAPPSSTSPAAYPSPDELCAHSYEVCDLRRDFYDRKAFNNTDDSEKIRLSFWPHPFASARFALMPAGYRQEAALGEFGFNVESTHLLAGVTAGYDNGRKVDDGNQPNPKGHDRHLGGGVYWRMTKIHRPKWFVGAGYEWSQLSTTNYKKGGARPTFGGGYDLYVDRLAEENCANCMFSARFTVNYVLAGSDWQNGSHGVDLGMTMPRPVEKRHIFFVCDLGIYRFHETVTEPGPFPTGNPPLTLMQVADKSTYGTYSLGVKWRFW